MSEIYISRNDFLRFAQCKKTWYLKNNELFENEINGIKGNGVHKTLNHLQSKIFRYIKSPGDKKFYEYARSLFSPLSPLKQIIPQDISLDEKLKMTKDLIDENTKILFSGWFKYHRLILFVDILQLQESWNAFSIRSGGGSLYSNSLDMALQYYILKKNEINLSGFWAIYINKRYRLKGEINTTQLLKVKNFLPELEENIELVEKLIDEISYPINESVIKNIDIGNHCFQPSPCNYMNICWNHVPENSIFDIATLDRAIKFKMYETGILYQKDIKKEDYSDFTPNQVLQIESTISQKVTLQISELKKFLQNIIYPVHYLDFESFMPVIPLFQDTHPFQQIPFEYCLYARLKESSIPEFKMFLAETTVKEEHLERPGDPRREFIVNLLNDLDKTKNSGSILVYDSRLEIQQLREMVILFPEFSVEVESIIARIVDLSYPFYKKLYYTPQMKGLYSIKNILPALIPSLNYEKLEIKNGYMAMHAFESLYYENRPDIIEETRNNLKEYCKMDVLALVEIHKFLENLVKNHK
ncbi:MAG: DUF2779 domain-containing protein [Spirochaetia bacterium]|nr:DUF2779 domain-containing protein [Spirochaetia bacterium]